MESSSSLSQNDLEKETQSTTVNTESHGYALAEVPLFLDKSSDAAKDSYRLRRMSECRRDQSKPFYVEFLLLLYTDFRGLLRLNAVREKLCFNDRCILLPHSSFLFVSTIMLWFTGTTTRRVLNINSDILIQLTYLQILFYYYYYYYNRNEWR